MKKLSTIFILSAIVIVLISASVSAYHAASSRQSETFAYTEDMKGRIRGFTITHTSSDSDNSNCDYYGRSYDDIRCRRNMRYSMYDPDYRSYYSQYNEDRAINQAFQTFQQNSRTIDRSRYSYFSYRYPSYGYRSYW